MLSHRLRLVPVNAADTAVIVASTQASADTGPAWLKTIGRTEIYRSAGTSATITATLASPITPVQCVALPVCNLSSAATIRVRVLSSTAAVLFDSGTRLACPPLAFDKFDWGFAPLGVNSFSFGMAPQAVIWLPERVAASSVVIDIADPFNPAGFVEAARLVIGDMWSPAYNFSNGNTLTWASQSKPGRAEDGTLRTEVGASMRKLTLSLDAMTADDRRRFSEIAQHLGTRRDFLLCACPQAEQDRIADYTMMAKFSRDPSSVSRFIGFFQSAIEIEEA